MGLISRVSSRTYRIFKMDTDDQFENIPPNNLKIYYQSLAPVQPSIVRGDKNLLRYFNSMKLYHKYCERNIKEKLSSYLSDIPGDLDNTNVPINQIIHKPPIQNDIIPLSKDQLKSFQLESGSLDDKLKQEFENQLNMKKAAEMMANNTNFNYNNTSQNVQQNNHTS